MIFLFRWKHEDGSIVEFSHKGWKADDPEKEAWLVKMSELCSAAPVIAPGIRVWLNETCQLVEYKGPVAPLSPARISDSTRELRPREPVNGSVSPTFTGRIWLFRRTRRKAKISFRMIFAYDGFFRSNKGPAQPDKLKRWHSKRLY
jgi:hypothetical protein